MSEITSEDNYEPQPEFDLSKLEKWIGNSTPSQAVHLTCPVHAAAAQGDVARLRELLCKDPQSTKVDEQLLNELDPAKNTALHWAAGSNQLNAMTFLLNSGCVMNEKNMLGDTPLHRAVWKGHRDSVQLLLQYGAKIDIRNNDNQLPVDLARDIEIAEMIRKAYEGESVLTGNNLGDDEEEFEIDEEATKELNYWSDDTGSDGESKTYVVYV